MTKNPIGFNTSITDNKADNVQPIINNQGREVKKSIVSVYFPDRDSSWSYYNDSFDLKVGDHVYVEGKLEGVRGQVVEVNYAFKIKISDYKKVIALVDTKVSGEFQLALSHLVTFDKNAIPYEKALMWFFAPENEDEYSSGDDEDFRFPLLSPAELGLDHEAMDRGHRSFTENRVSYLCLDGNKGHAIVCGSTQYQVEFCYDDGIISNIKCNCYCSGACKHEFAVLLQLRETLAYIEDNFADRYNGYFAAITKGVFMNVVINKNGPVKISLEG